MSGNELGQDDIDRLLGGGGFQKSAPVDVPDSTQRVAVSRIDADTVARLAPESRIVLDESPSSSVNAAHLRTGDRVRQPVEGSGGTLYSGGVAVARGIIVLRDGHYYFNVTERE